MKGIVDQLNVCGNKIPYFTMTLFPLITYNETVPPDIDNIENNLLKFKISYKIFSLWQEVLLSLPFIDLDHISFICNFLQKASSKELYKQWLLCKLDFNIKTQQFGDLLFKYALNIQCHTSDVYINVSNQLLKDSEYITVISSDS